MLSCRLTSGPLWLRIYPFLWWFLLVIFGLFLLHWRSEIPCQDKLPEFHCTPILGCIRVLWLVFHPSVLGLDKALCGWNSVSSKTSLQLSKTNFSVPLKTSTSKPFAIVTVAILNQSIRKLLTHLFENYGNITQLELEDNDTKMHALRDPNSP